MKFGKKVTWLLKAAFICGISAALAVGFNIVRPKPYSFQELTTPQQQSIAEISLLEMFKAFDSGSAAIVDARSDTDFAMGHIPGAINIPSWAIGDELTEASSQIEQGRPVIVYCDGMSCGKSMTVAKKLVEKGFKNVSVYADGIDGWLSAGRNLEAN